MRSEGVGLGTVVERAKTEGLADSVNACFFVGLAQTTSFRRAGATVDGLGRVLVPLAPSCHGNPIAAYRRRAFTTPITTATG